MKEHEIIRQQIERWRTDGVIDHDTADTLRDHITPPPSPWSRFDTSKLAALIFGGFGAVAIGLGVILFFAFNWNEMDKFTKLTAVVLPLILAHGTGFLLRYKKFPKWAIETAHLMGTMFFGAAVILVAQIYHIEDHAPNFLLLWSIVALAMALAMSSTPQALLAAVLCPMWLGFEIEESYALGDLYRLSPLVVGALFIYLARSKRSTLIHIFGTLSMGLMLIFATIHRNSDETFVLISIPLFLLALPALFKNDPEFPLFKPVYRFLGVLSWTIVLAVCSFKPPLEEIIDINYFSRTPLAVIVLAVILAGLLIPWFFCAKNNEWRSYDYWINRVGTALALLSLIVLASLQINDLATVFAPVFAGLFILLMLVRIWFGCRESQLFPVIANVIALAVWMGIRFCTWFESLMVRGIVFAAIGALLIGVAVLYHRSTRKEA